MNTVLDKGKIELVQHYNMWDFGNQILYDMCQKAPLHINEEEVISKVWLIGRSYAAAIERGAKSAYKGDEFYKHVVGKKIKSIGKELDKRISFFSEQEQVTKNLLGKIAETHNYLTKVFYDISGMDNRSLASKYLHFHVPNVFYIYDSRAIASVTNLNTLDRNLKKDLLKLDSDLVYVDFLAKVYPLNEKIYKEYGVWLKPREIDALLLQY